MFNALVAAQESLNPVVDMEEEITLLSEAAEDAINAAQVAEATLKEVTTLRKFSTLLGETTDKESLVRIADTDGSLSALMGVDDTSELLTMSMESLGEATANIADAGEASIKDGEEDAGSAVKAKRKKAILATCAALAAVATAIAGYKLVKGRMSKEQQDTIINTINDLKPEGAKITELPENPAQAAATEINKTITELKASGDASETKPKTTASGSAAGNLRANLRKARKAEAQFKRASQNLKTA